MLDNEYEGNVPSIMGAANERCLFSLQVSHLRLRVSYWRCLKNYVKVMNTKILCLELDCFASGIFVLEGNHP